MMDNKAIELMLENDQITSSERLSSLEKKVQQQNDELICLRSALSDVIRRLQHVEQQQQQHQQHHTQSSSSTSHKSSNMSRPSTSNSLIKQSNSKNLVSSSTHSLDIPSKESKSPNSIRSKDTEKHSPNEKSNKNNTKLQDSQQTLTFNKDAGLIKFFLRGRPITLYLPTSYQALAESNEIGFKYDPDAKIKAPKENLKLEWVYGYRGKDCRSNLYQLPTGEIIYFIAATVVLYNIEERTQRHYTGHNDDIKSLAIHPDMVTIATGQAAGHDKQEGKPHVRIWDSINLTTLKIIGLGSSNEFQNSICCLSFSKADGGQNLAIVDDGGERWLSVWNWQNAQKITSTKCYGDMVFAAEFHPLEKNLIITAGKQHIIFWTLDSQHLNKVSGSFEVQSNTIICNGTGQPISTNSLRIDKPKYVLSVSFSHNGEVVSGDSDGNIIFWNQKEGRISRVIKEAHDGGVFSIHVLTRQEETSDTQAKVSMISGGKDGKLIEWNNDYQKTGRQLQLPESNGTCRFISSGSGNMLLVGTTKNSIFTASFDLDYLNCLMNGHSEELWGLSQKGSNFLTCGNDKNLYYWDSLSHSLLWSAQLEDQMHCAHIHPKLDLVAIGLIKSKWIIFDFSERKTVYTQIEGNEQIECIQFSPNGNYLACGSRNNYIYIYSVSENGLKYSRIGRCSGHSSFITHIDWSVDSEFLMSNSGDYEILFWQASNCKQITQVQQIREIEWATNYCTLSVNTFGIWNSTDSNDSNSSETSNLDGTDINATCVSSNKKLLVSVDDFGKVNLYGYPCAGQKSEKKSYHGHSSHVTNASFINDDSRLVTTGGNDSAIFQWSIIKE